MYDECQPQSAQVWALPREQANQDDANDTPPHSVRCMHAVIGKFTNLHFGILDKSEILGLRGLKVCP